VTPSAGAKLGVKVLGAAEAKDLLQKVDVTREKNETFSVVGEKGGQASIRPPVYCSNRSTQRPPSALIGRECYNLLTLRNQMGTQYWAHARRVAGALELDRSVDPIGVGAGERANPPLGGDTGEYFGAGDAEAEGKVAVGVEVDHSKKRKR
jgi:hypothetical protein